MSEFWGKHMTLRARILVSAGFAAVAACGAAHAHHSVTGSFDPSRTVEITGDVVEWRFRNPHTMLIVDGTAVIDGKRDDVTRRWEIESSAAAGLRASGVDEKTFSPGERVTVKGMPHRNPTTYRANASAARAHLSTRTARASSAASEARRKRPSHRPAAVRSGSSGSGARRFSRTLRRRRCH